MWKQEKLHHSRVWAVDQTHNQWPQTSSGYLMCLINTTAETSNPTKRPKPAVNVSWQVLCVMQPVRSSTSEPQSSIKHTSMSHTAVHSNSSPHTPSCCHSAHWSTKRGFIHCWKQSPTNAPCPPLNWICLKMKLFINELFLKMYVLISTNGSHRQS